MPTYIIEAKKKVAAEGGQPEASLALPRVVTSKNAAQALGHVVEDTLTVRLADPVDLIAAGKAGIEIETVR